MIKILVLQNTGVKDKSVDKQLNKMKKYFSKSAPEAFGVKPREFDVDILKVDFPIFLKVVGTNTDGRKAKGADDIKRHVRDMVSEGEYDAVFFMYDGTPSFTRSGWYNAAFTYNEPLYVGTQMVQVPDVSADDTFQHEWMHCEVRLHRENGHSVLDQMDETLVDGKWMPYYKNNDATYKGGNYHQTFKAIDHLFTGSFDKLVRNKSPWQQETKPKEKPLVTTHSPISEDKLESVQFGGEDYPVEFKQTPNVSHTTMKKIGLVTHVTTSNSYKGTRSWLTNKNSNVSALFIVGRNVGEIVQLGLPNQKFWHAGVISEPSSTFKKVAKYTTTGAYANPNLYLDGIEFSGGVDKNNDKKVTADEVELTEWQHHCAEVIARWHARVCGYDIDDIVLLTHQDITSYKPDTSEIVDELNFRLFQKTTDEYQEAEELQKKLTTRRSIIELLIRMLLSFKK